MAVKIIVTKLRESHTGDVEYTRKKMAAFSETLRFGEKVKTMGSIVTPYSYNEVCEYVVTASEKDAKISEIKSMLSGHISFNIKIEENVEAVEKKEYQAEFKKEEVQEFGKNKGMKKTVKTIHQISMANDFESALAIAEKFIMFNSDRFGKLVRVSESTVESDDVFIADAEHLLFELDMSISDEITVTAGMNKESVTYSRKDIEKSVFSTVNNVTHSFNFMAGVHTLRLI